MQLKLLLWNLLAVIGCVCEHDVCYTYHSAHVVLRGHFIGVVSVLLHLDSGGGAHAVRLTVDDCYPQAILPVQILSL